MSTRKRHIPLRTCVLCGNKTSKKELTRVVATPDGTVLVDASGRLPGRGAYLCASGDCRSTELSRGRLEYALRTKLSEERWGHFTERDEMVKTSP